MAAKEITQDQIVNRLDELPTLPTVVYELTKIINDPMSSTNDVEKVMNSDLSLTTKVLKLANSAYYAIPGGVTSLSRAIGYLGFDTVNQLVLSASIFEALDVKGPQRFDMNEFWRHSIGVAIASEVVAKKVHHPTPSDMFTAGLIHDMGKVALYTLEQDTMLAIVEKAEKENLSYNDAEIQMKIPAHTVIGQALSKKWALPPVIPAVIRFHHDKVHNQRAYLPSDTNRNIDIVYLANILVHALKFGYSGHKKILGAPIDVIERLGMKPETDFKPLLAEVKISLDRGSDFLRVLGTSGK